MVEPPFTRHNILPTSYPPTFLIEVDIGGIYVPKAQANGQFDGIHDLFFGAMMPSAQAQNRHFSPIAEGQLIHFLETLETM